MNYYHKIIKNQIENHEEKEVINTHNHVLELFARRGSSAYEKLLIKLEKKEKELNSLKGLDNINFKTASGESSWQMIGGTECSTSVNILEDDILTMRTILGLVEFRKSVNRYLNYEDIFLFL